MARQEDACWRCGTQWANEDEPRTALRVIDGGAPAHAPEAPQTSIVATAAAAMT
jgi:hypothetical protein